MIEIRINVHPDFGDLTAQMDRAAAALGFVRATGNITLPISPEVAEIIREEVAEYKMPAEMQGTYTADHAQTPAPTRERGKPSPGRARRTKEEIAEDEAAEKAAPATGQSISTGGERVEETDDAETAAQDAADEAAEAGPASSGPITIQDLKDIAGAYIQLHGMPAVQEDGHKILGAALGTPPEGEVGWRMSIIPEDKYETAYTAFKAAVDAGKRFGT